MKKKLMTLEQRRLLREAQQLLALSERQKAKKKTSEASESGDNTNTTVRLTRQEIDILTKRNEFRNNLLTEETEFRPAGQRDFAFFPYAAGTRFRRASLSGKRIQHSHFRLEGRRRQTQLAAMTAKSTAMTMSSAAPAPQRMKSSGTASCAAIAAVSARQ